MKPLTILNINTHEARGGAACVARQLHRSFLERGHDSWYVVREKNSDDQRVLSISNREGRWKKACRRLSAAIHARNPEFAAKVHRALVADIGQPLRWLNSILGREDMLYPDTKRILSLLPAKPDVILCHNLHGGYFDLRQLPALCRAAPVALSMHDAWLLAGHCAHSLGCDKWLDGCGPCPDVGRSVALRRDGSRGNWKIKKRIYASSDLTVITPCHWLMKKVERSILAGGMRRGHVIPYGIDQGDIFHPGSRSEARQRLGLPDDAFICLFVSNGLKTNIWKDFETLEQAVSRLSHLVGERRVLFLGLGEAGNAEWFGRAAVRYVPFLDSAQAVADYYRAADVYVHAARADTFPNVILEAQACGLPVVATAVSGIPEQIVDGETGFLTPPRDGEAMARALARLVENPGMAREMGRVASRRARSLYPMGRMVDDYLRCLSDMAAEAAKTGT